MKLTNNHKRQLDELISQTIVPAIAEDLEIEDYSREVEAYEYLVEKLTKILNKTKLCS